MVNKVSNSNWDADPEIGEHAVRYSAYVKKSRLSPEKRPFLPYGVGPIVDCEVDDDTGKPDYLSYSIIPKENKETITKEQSKELKQTKQKPNSELSLDHVYKVVRELKLPTFQRIIRQNKFELMRIAKRRPDRYHIYVAKLLLRTIFNPVQKVWIYSQIREVLNIPPREFAVSKFI
ncbi:hypothetical protein ACI65C_009508 [Semiaphis heraclei]